MKINVFNLPNIIYMPITAQRFTTLGDWWQDENGAFTIAISNMDDWRYEFLVLIHELTEWSICQISGISTSACDAFDTVWEKKIEAGLVSPDIEAGFDKSCPYRKGHIWGARMERLFCWLLKANWQDYNRACDALIREYTIYKSIGDNNNYAA